MPIRDDVEREARAAGAAAASLTDEAVAAALVEPRPRCCANAAARCSPPTTPTSKPQRAGSTKARSTGCGWTTDGSAVLERQLLATAALDPLEREIGSRTLANGLVVSERRIPIGVVGANFEARPNVALDVAGQLLKSLNAAVLRTGAAALRTVTVLVDDVLRPALEEAGLPPEAVGLVRHADREGARVLVSMPSLVPLVILRGSGPSTAELVRLAAQNDVRTLAHAEGGGVLYVHAAADRGKALALAEASLDRLGVCNRLNLALVDRGAEELLMRAARPVRRRRTWMCEATFPAASRSTGRSATSGRATPSASRPSRSPWSTGSTRRWRSPTRRPPGWPPASSPRTPPPPIASWTGYRGTAVFWHAPTRFTDGFELTGSPETGINVDRVPGPRGPVTYRDLWLRQYRVIGDGRQTR